MSWRNGHGLPDLTAIRGCMNGPSDLLRSEHVAIEDLLCVLDEMAKRLAANQPVPREDLLDAMMVVVEFGDRCHQIKEEDHVFPALSVASPKAGANLARQMSRDHRELRQLALSMRQLLPRVGDSKSLRVELEKDLRKYTRLLREHIRIEEETLFPEFDRAVGTTERTKIAREFDRLEREDVGWGLHEAYHAIIHRLGEAYGT